MQSAVQDESAASTQTAAPAQSRREVSVAEAVTLGAAGVVGIVSLVSLALAHIHQHSLGAVAVVSLVIVIAAASAVRRFDRQPFQLDLPGLVPFVVGIGLAAIFFLPGFQYGTGDRDPGAYIEIGSAIARTHGLPFPDDLAAAHLPGGASPGAEWAALWDQPGHPGQIFPQFYHLWPALLATAKDAGGFTGMFDTGPLVGLIAVAAALLVGRRIAGLAGAWTVAVLLPTNMLEVWQAKYPSAEMFGQMLFIGAVLGVVLAIRTGWRSAAGLAGVLLALGYLERADGILMVLFAWAVLCVLYAAGRFDARAGWFAVGLVVLLPYGFFQAYHLARIYTVANSVPSLPKVLLAMVTLAVGAVVLAALRPRWQGLLDWGDRPRSRRLLGSTYVGICALLVVIAGLRPKLFGKDYALYGGRPYRTYDEISFIRLTWFFSLTGIALMCLGIAFVGWHRWRLDRWLIGLATSGLLALYCYHVRNSPYMMWSTRRFVTTVVPGMVLLMACGSAALVIVLQRIMSKLAVSARARGPVLATCLAALLLGLTAFGVSESWPLRHHNENGGAVEVESELAALSGAQRGVYLWQRAGACCDAPYMLFGGPMMTVENESSALLPAGAFEPASVKRYVDYFRDTQRPVFYVANGATPPPHIDGITATKVRELSGVLPHLEETYVSRPKNAHNYPYDVVVYRLTATGSA